MNGGGAATAVTSAVEPILSSNGDAPQGVFGRVVVSVEPARLGVAAQRRPVRERIIHGGADVTLGQDLGSFGLEPSVEVGKQRPRSGLSLRRDPRCLFLEG